VSTISEFNAAANADTDREHQVQLGLLQELCNAARENHAAALVAEILEQLIAYSEAHFMSEERADAAQELRRLRGSRR